MLILSWKSCFRFPLRLHRNLSPAQCPSNPGFLSVCPLRCPAQAAAAALLAASPMSLAGSAFAGEFDLLAEGTPSSYVIDDAGVLNKTTRKSMNDELKALEVGSRWQLRCQVSGMWRCKLTPRRWDDGGRPPRAS